MAAIALGSWHTVGVTFEEVYTRFRSPVWRLARRLTASDEEALDACQEIFVRVWRGLGGFRGEAKLSTWIFQIAWNYLRWHRRRRIRQPLWVVRDNDDGDSPLDRVADPAPDPERQATSVERLARLRSALAELPEHHRVVIWLRDGEDLSYEEIADVLGVPIGTVRSRLARARATLRAAVEG
jgi:RNA polymerase sigma factor (sigma-70 family)